MRIRHQAEIPEISATEVTRYTTVYNGKCDKGLYRNCQIGVHAQTARGGGVPQCLATPMPTRV